MSVSKAKQLSNKKHDSTHFKYQSVKLKIGEYESLKKAVELSEEPMNAFLRTAIMQRVNEYVCDSLPPRAAETPPAPEVSGEMPTAPEDSKTVEELELSIRTYNAVKRAGCDTVGQLRAYISSEKCSFSKGGRTYKEIAEALNLPLSSDPSPEENSEVSAPDRDE